LTEPGVGPNPPGHREGWRVRHPHPAPIIRREKMNYSMDILRANVEAGLVGPALKTRIMKSHFSLENVKKFLQANDLVKGPGNLATAFE
jgi:hypothetical protein